MSSRRIRPAAPWLLLAGLGAGLPALAGWDVHFAPSADLRVEKTGNVNVVGGSEQSDIVTGLSVRLALEADRPATSLRFSYLPQRQTFQDFGNFDNTAHTVQGSLNHQGPTGSNYNLQLNASRTQQQGIDPDNPGGTVSLVPRTTIERAQLQWGGSTAPSVRSVWTWAFRGAVNRFEDLPTVDFEDSDEAGMQLGWGRSVSVKTSWAIQYSLQVIDPERSESTEAHSLRWAINHQFGRYLSGRAAAGSFFTSVGSEAFTDPAVELALTRSGATSWATEIGVRQSVSSGTGEGGATLDRSLYTSYQKTSRTGKLGFGINASFARRESFDTLSGDPRTVESALAQTTINWQPLRGLSMGVFHRYVNQDSTASTATAPADADYHAGGLFLAYTRPRKQ